MATLQEIADAWGCSQPYISKLKNKGMPTDTIENATAWRENNRERSGKLPSNSISGGVVIPKDTSVPVSKGDLSRDDIYGCLARARNTEKVSYAILHNAQVNNETHKLPSLVKAHREAVKSRMEAEIKVESLQVAMGSKIDADVARNIFARYMMTIRNLMEGLGASVCRRANPSDPELAKDAIADGVKQIIAVIEKTKGGKLGDMKDVDLDENETILTANEQVPQDIEVKA
jgi:hypothetical protein